MILECGYSCYAYLALSSFLSLFLFLYMLVLYFWWCIFRPSGCRPGWLSVCWSFFSFSSSVWISLCTLSSSSSLSLSLKPRWPRPAWWLDLIYSDRIAGVHRRRCLSTFQWRICVHSKTAEDTSWKTLTETADTQRVKNRAREKERKKKTQSEVNSQYWDRIRWLAKPSVIIWDICVCIACVVRTFQFGHTSIMLIWML